MGSKLLQLRVTRLIEQKLLLIDPNLYDNCCIIVYQLISAFDWFSKICYLI